jgi:hypothetical protein
VGLHVDQGGAAVRSEGDRADPTQTSRSTSGDAGATPLAKGHPEWQAKLFYRTPPGKRWEGRSKEKTDTQTFFLRRHSDLWKAPRVTAHALSMRGEFGIFID